MLDLDKNKNMPDELESLQEPCLKCLKKYGAELANWTPCKNCPWITKKPESPLIQQEKVNDMNMTHMAMKNMNNTQKICLECQELLSFLEPEKGKYLCGKVKCLRSYIERHSEENNQKK